ncbi:MAG: tetratricopeptide repeat protein [Lentisphaerales bacterium]|jgi:tetratricopeptide (TPR) repeat protein|nr:MAG: tetratricopeptide repeat protein [Lentisphaerales bacterium]
MEAVITNQVVSLTIATMMSLGQWLGDGAEAYRQKKYETASKAFTKVIEARIQPNPLRESALLLRAQSSLHAKKTNEAVADIESVLKGDPRSPIFRLAVADYKKMTGKDWGGIDLSTPESTWRSLVGAVQRGDVVGLKRCCTGQLLAELLELIEDEPAGFQEIANELAGTEFISATMNVASNKACVVLSEGDDPGGEEKVVMQLEDGCWLLAAEYDEDDFREFEFGQARAGQVYDDANKFRLIDAAMEMYVLEYGRPPAGLEDIRDYVKNFDRTVISASDGKPFVFSVPRQASGGQVMPWVFGATSVDGRRHGLIDGQLRHISEREFLALAGDKGVSVPGERVAVGLTDDDEAKISDWIRKLGSETYADRTAAMKGLREFGAKAEELLRRAVNDKDPEIAVSVRELLSEL